MTTLDLRPLSLGELLDRTFFLYRRNFLLFIGISAIPYSLVLIVNLSSTLFTRLRLGVAPFPIPGHIPSAGLGPSALVVSGLLGILVGLATFVAYLFSVGGTVFAVSEIYMGRPTSIHASLRRVRGKAGIIFGVLFLSVLILIGGLILLVIPAIYFSCRICVATAAALLEDIGPGEAISRSFALTKDFAGRAFMIFLLYFALAWIIIAVFQMPFFVLITFSARQPQLVTIWMVLMQVANFFGTILIAPISTIGFALFYYDLRVRKEALDLQLMMQSLGGQTTPPPIAGGIPSIPGPDAL